MKVLLISPNFGSDAGRPLLGLAYIASVIRKEHEVKILDLALYCNNFDKLNSTLNEFNPDVVGISSYTITYKTSMEIARIVKSYNNKIVTIMGGAHPSIRPNDCLNEYVDFVIRGEGEYSFRDILDYLLHRRTINDISGISYKYVNVNIHKSQRIPIQQIDTIPCPSRDLLEIEKYSHPVITILTSRGCPFACNYCYSGVLGKRFRPHSPYRVIEEIKDAMKTSPYRHIFFIDDLFTFDKERVKRICELIVSENLNITWHCNGRIGLDKNLIILMKEAGCTRLGFGVESGDDYILKSIKKGITIDGVRKTFRECKEVGIEATAYFMIGHWEDTKETIQKTINFAFEINPTDISWSITTPLPGTELWELFDMENRINSGWNSFDYMNEANRANFDIKYLKKEEIQTLYNEAITKWKKHILYRNLHNPSFILKNLMSPVSSTKRLINLMR